MYDVAIIIVTYNSEEYIRQCLNSIYEKTINIIFEIFIVDNFSEDNTVKIIESEYPDVKLIRNNENIGFARANNKAIKNSSSKYLFLLNPDTFLINNAIGFLFDFMKNNEDSRIWCIGGLLHEHNQKPINYFYNFPSLKIILWEQTLLYRLFPNKFHARQRIYFDVNKSKCIQVPFVNGSNMFMKRNIMESLGMFDESFFLYCEELELQFRANLNSYNSMILTDAKVYHYGGKSSKTSLKYYKELRKGEINFIGMWYGNVNYYLVKIIYFVGITLRYLVTFDKNYLDIIKFLFQYKRIKKKYIPLIPKS